MSSFLHGNVSLAKCQVRPPHREQCLNRERGRRWDNPLAMKHVLLYPLQEKILVSLLGFQSKVPHSSYKKHEMSSSTHQPSLPEL